MNYNKQEKRTVEMIEKKNSFVEEKQKIVMGGEKSNKLTNQIEDRRGVIVLCCSDGEMGWQEEGGCGRSKV